MSDRWSLQITEADHEANVFRTLGGATWPTEAEQRAAFDAIPEEPWGEGESYDWIVDLLGPDDFSIVENKCIALDTALTLLGEEGIEAVRAAADEGHAQGMALAETWLDRRESPDALSPATAPEED